MSETDSFSNETFERLLKIWTDNLKGNVFIKPPENKGWLEKRNTKECWISNKVFGGAVTWKKKYFSVQLFDVIMRYSLSFLGICFSVKRISKRYYYYNHFTLQQFFLILCTFLFIILYDTIVHGSKKY